MKANLFYLMEVFVAVAETEGFAAGSVRLNISAPAATRAIAALERHLDVRLLDRTTRYVRVTDAGRQFLADAKRILLEVETTQEVLRGTESAPAGQLGVTASVLFGEKYVTPVIADYLRRYPQTSINAMYLDRPVNLIEEGLDVGLRIGHLADSSLRGRQVGTVRVVTCAAPDYLARYGTPESPKSLASHTLIASNTTNAFDWRYKNSRSLSVHPRLIFNNNTAAIDAACRGCGIARVLSYQIDSQLTQNRLKLVLQAHEPDPLPVTIVHRNAPHPSAKVRAFVDLLADSLQSRFGASLLSR